MNLRTEDHGAVNAWLARVEARSASPPVTAVASGSIGWGTGGPVWLDAQRTRRAPSPPELVNAYKAVAAACINLNAFGVARVPLRLYARTRGGERAPGRGLRSISRQVQPSEMARLRRSPQLTRVMAGSDRVDEVFDHPLLHALSHVNEYFDGNLLMLFLSICLDAVGTAYFKPLRPSPEVACNEIWPLHAQYVMPMKGAKDQVMSSYTYFGQTFAPDELVRIRHVSIRDPYLSGYAPLHQCLEQVGLVDYYTSVMESILQGGGRPSGMLSPADPATQVGSPERRRLEIDVNNAFTHGRQGRILIPPGGKWDFTEIGFPPTDLAGLELTKHARLLAANCFGVPISLLQSEGSNRAVAQESTYMHQYYGIEPRCNLIAGALTKYLAHPVDQRLFFAFDEVVNRDRKLDAELVDMAIKNGTRTINEVKLEAGEQPVEWGDEPWLSNSLSQPSDRAEPDDELETEQLEDGDSNAKPKPEAIEEDEELDNDADGENDTEKDREFRGKALEVLEAAQRELARQRRERRRERARGRLDSFDALVAHDGSRDRALGGGAGQGSDPDPQESG